MLIINKVITMSLIDKAYKNRKIIQHSIISNWYVRSLSITLIYDLENYYCLHTRLSFLEDSSVVNDKKDRHWTKKMCQWYLIIITIGFSMSIDKKFDLLYNKTLVFVYHWVHHLKVTELMRTTTWTLQCQDILTQ